MSLNGNINAVATAVADLSIQGAGIYPNNGSGGTDPDATISNTTGIEDSVIIPVNQSNNEKVSPSCRW